MIHEWIHDHWKRLAWAALVALIVGYGTNFYYLRHTPVHAQPKDRSYWEGQVDEKLRVGEAKDIAIFTLMEKMNVKIDNICTDITEVKVQAARNGVIYGAGSGGGVIVILQLIQFLAKRRNGK